MQQLEEMIISEEDKKDKLDGPRPPPPRLRRPYSAPAPREQAPVPVPASQQAQPGELNFEFVPAQPGEPVGQGARRRDHAPAHRDQQLEKTLKTHNKARELSRKATRVEKKAFLLFDKFLDEFGEADDIGKWSKLVHYRKEELAAIATC